MTTIARLLPDRDRERLLARLRELRETARLMEERGSLASPAAPVPLHRTGRGTGKETRR